MLSGAEARAFAEDFRRRICNLMGPASALAILPTRYLGSLTVRDFPECQVVTAIFSSWRGAVKFCARTSRVAFPARRVGDAVNTLETSTPVSSSAPPSPSESAAHGQARAATTPSTLG